MCRRGNNHFDVHFRRVGPYFFCRKMERTRSVREEVLIMTDSRYKNYKANEDRITLKDGLLFRKYFGETGSIKYYQILIPKQLVKEVLRSLHGEFGKHPGIFKTIIAYRETYYFSENGAINQGMGHVM